MFYVGFASASLPFVEWLRGELFNLLRVKGHITKVQRKSMQYQLKYAKAEGFQVLQKMYRPKNAIYLKRKYLKIKNMLDIVGQRI